MACADLTAAQRLLECAVSEMRGWLRDQPPASAAAESLEQALRRIALEIQRDGAGCHVAVRLDATLPTLSTRTRWELARITQEALRNAVRHGCARAVEIQLDNLAHVGVVRLRVHDDGVGFDPAAPPPPEAVRFGLRAMRARAERLGGRFSVASRPGAGTQITAAVPVALLPMRPGAGFWPALDHAALDH